MQTYVVNDRDRSQLLARWRDDRDMLYDRVLHEEKTGDMYMLVPRGKKCCLWFTYHREQPACFIVEIDRRSNPVDFIQVACAFDRSLAYDTVLSGVLIDTRGKLVFCTLFIQIWKGQRLTRHVSKQLSMMCRLTTTGVENHPALPLLSIAVPTMCEDKSKLNACRLASKVPIFGIRVADTKQDLFLGVYRPGEMERPNCVLLVKPEVEEDTYSLWSGDKVGYALVPDYKTSVRMNKIFRNIKENDDLDALEMSDDEDEFEDVAEDRFLKHKDGLAMEMENRGGSWYPLQVVNKPPTPLDELRHHGGGDRGRHVNTSLRPVRKQDQMQQRGPRRANQPSKRVRGYLGFN